MSEDKKVEKKKETFNGAEPAKNEYAPVRMEKRFLEKKELKN